MSCKRTHRGHGWLLSSEWWFEEEAGNEVGDKGLGDLQGTSLRWDEQDTGSLVEGELFSLNLIFFNYAIVDTFERLYVKYR